MEKITVRELITKLLAISDIDRAIAFGLPKPEEVVEEDGSSVDGTPSSVYIAGEIDDEGDDIVLR